MEHRVKISMLIDLYDSLLTTKQKDIMTLYYNDDLSLAEISEITNTSRQAVFDTIKRCEKSLQNYENKLNLLHRNTQIEEAKKNIMLKLTEIKGKDIDSRTSESVKDIENYLSGI